MWDWPIADLTLSPSWRMIHGIKHYKPFAKHPNNSKYAPSTQ